MKTITKKILGLFLIGGLIIGLSACSSATSADPYADTSQLFSSINRVEKFNPGAMNFTKDQAEKIIAQIDPVLNGAIYTTALAEDIYKQVNGLLTKEQKALIVDAKDSLGVPPEGAVPGTGAGTGAGGGGMGAGHTDGVKPDGATGAGGVPQTGSSTIDSSINMFSRVEQMLINNYLN